MQYIHIRNLEKYHPGYKDRTLHWGKIFINMASGDPETELLDEIDWSRLIKLILLELRAKKPLPLDDGYLKNKGFDLKKRPMSLTLQMLHNFLDVVTLEKNEPYVEKIREDKKREDKNVYPYHFDTVWNRYPRREGKKEAQRHFEASVKTDKDYEDIQKALDNYLLTDSVKKGYIKMGSTWFNNWRDYVDFTGVSLKSQAMIEMERMIGK